MRPSGSMSVSWDTGEKKPSVSEALTLEARGHPGSKLLASSAGLGWSTIAAELRSHGADEALTIAPQQVQVSVIIAGNRNALVTRTISGECQKAVPRNGTIWLSPIGVRYKVMASAPVPKMMHLFLPTTTFRRLGDEFGLTNAALGSIRSAARS